MQSVPTASTPVQPVAAPVLASSREPSRLLHLCCLLLCQHSLFFLHQSSLLLLHLKKLSQNPLENYELEGVGATTPPWQIAYILLSPFEFNVIFPSSQSEATATQAIFRRTPRVSSRNFILGGGKLTDHVAIRPPRGEGAGGGCVPSCVKREAKKY